VANSTPNVILIGPTGSGKTAVGRQLARETGLKFVDSDHEIENRTGVEISYIFEKEGEAGFREREMDMIKELAGLKGAVIATGGGAILAKQNRERIAASGIVVYLKTGVTEQLKRTSRTRKRPLLNNRNPRKVLEEMAAVRGPLYEEIADVSLDTSSQRVRSVAKKLQELLEQRDDWHVGEDT
jgi:shikimate kinase